MLSSIEACHTSIKGQFQLKVVEHVNIRLEYITSRVNSSPETFSWNEKKSLHVNTATVLVICNKATQNNKANPLVKHRWSSEGGQKTIAATGATIWAIHNLERWTMWMVSGSHIDVFHCRHFVFSLKVPYYKYFQQFHIAVRGPTSLFSKCLISSHLLLPLILTRVEGGAVWTRIWPRRRGSWRSSDSAAAAGCFWMGS